MSVERGSRATYRGRRVVVTEPVPSPDGAGWWRVTFLDRPVMRALRSRIVPGPNLQDVEPPPVFEVGQLVRLIGRPVSGTVVEVAERDGRVMYAVEIPDGRDRPVVITPGAGWYGPERIA